MAGARDCTRTLFIYVVMEALSCALAGKVSPTGSDALLSSSPVTARPSPPAIYLPASFKMSNVQLAFFLRKAAQASGASPAPGHPLQRSESFVVFQTKELPAVNISLGPFVRDQTLSKELLQPASPLDISGQLTVNWKVRAFIVQPRVFSNNAAVQVFFYIAGRDWDDFKAQDKLPCVRLHAFRDVREMKTSCRMKGNLAQCLARLDLPPSWFNANVAPLGRRKGDGGPTGETLRAELYYTLREPDADGGCGEGAGQRGGRGEAPSQHPLLRIGSISLYQASREQLLVDKQLDKNMFLRLPEKPLKPGETLRIFLYLMPNSTVEQFSLKVKAKKGVNLIQTTSKNAQWKVDWEVLSGAKHSITTIDVNKNKALKQGEAAGNAEVMQLDFEMENFTSLSVTRRINWNIDYNGQSPPPESEKVVTELTVVQRDIQAILPLAMDTEIINTAVLTGRTVAIPVKMVSIEMNGAVTDVSAFVQCKSANEDIVKVSMNCDYVFVNGKETRGSMNARVIFSYEHLSAPLELTVWVPKLPLRVELSDDNLSFIKGWRVPILPDRRSTRDSDGEEDEDDRRVSRGCTLQYQRALVKVLTQFHTTSSEGTEQVITMLGPDWQVDVTELVQDSLKVADPRVAELVDRTVLVGLELGSTVLKVDSPLAVDAALGQAAFAVTDDKVSISQLRVHAVSGLSLALRPSPGNSHTLVAKATGLQTLAAPKQEASLSVWMLFSDDTAASLTYFDPKDYNFNASALDDKVVSVSQEPQQRWPVVVAEGEGEGELLRVEMTIGEACQKTKRKSVIASAAVYVRVRFGSDDDDDWDEEGGVESPTTAGGPDPDGRLQDTSDERPAGVPIGYTDRPTAGKAARPAPTDAAEGEEEDEEDEDDFTPSPRNMSDLEIGMYALLGVFCLAILVFLINCIVFVLKYRHKRIPPEGQVNTDHSHHWVFLGNGRPPGAQCELAARRAADSPPEPAAAAEGGGGRTCCHGDHHSSGSSQTSVQSVQAHGRGDGSSGGEEAGGSPTSKRKRVKFTTFATMPAAANDDLPYNAVPVADDEDIQWVCRDMGFQDPEELHDYMRRIKEMA
ncbi:transmembrane protein 132E-like isoform X2 [Hippocampus zosterae]|uniref:transmembrane protein 132E-like isoform X2 n=1 Tax=Hippocampus zosterae TaxID=109293 RepID=UPI00223D21D8|nr:transmembrane protein 132E-like isoform X2 [Hippocampus zosterae]